MVKVCGTYRWKDGARFDPVYYRTEHMRITRELLLPLGLQRLESDETQSAGEPKPGAIVASSNAYFLSLAAAQAALNLAGAKLLVDVPNFTDINPEIHVCAVTRQYHAGE